MYNICDMCSMYGRCTCATSVIGVTHIADETHATSRTHIPHMICIRVDTGTGKRDTSGIALVRSRGTAGVAAGDGRHLPFPTCQEAPELDDGCAIRYASVHWTPSAPVMSGYGMFNTACRVSPRPIRTVSLVQVVFDEPPPGRTAIGSSPHRGRSEPSRHTEEARYALALQSSALATLRRNPRGWMGTSRSERDEFRASEVSASWQGPIE